MTPPAPDGTATPPPAAPATTLPDRLAGAWERCYLDPMAARVQAVPPDGATDADRAWCAVVTALAAALSGDVPAATAALAQARDGFGGADTVGGAEADRTEAEGTDAASGRHWCDEIDAIVVRRSGRPREAQALQQALDDRPVPRTVAPGAPDPEALLQFVGQCARAATARLLGDLDTSLRHHYEADDAAARAGLPGLRIVSLSNLGALHQDLFNLDDARRFTEQALAAARAARSPQMVGTAAANLIVIHHASGEPRRNEALMQVLLEEERDLLPAAPQRYATQLALAELDIGRPADALRRLQAVSPDGGAVPAREPSHRIFWHWLRARGLLDTGHPEAAADVAEAELATHTDALWRSHPYLSMELLRAATEAHERQGRTDRALVRLRQAHGLYELLAGRGARARYVALEVAWRLRNAQQERDLAVRLQAMAESEHRRLHALNAALQDQIRETERLHGQLREQAVRDALTGLHNRRFLFEAAPPLLHRATREGRPVAVAMLDLDHFKQLNDTRCHDAGDHVLQAFARLLRERFRAGDLVCRHGGEEFVFVGDVADAEAALALLRRVLQAWQATRLEHAGAPLPPGSFSAGVAVLGRDGDTLETLLRHADAALYRAKADGRGQVRLHGT